jgi:hypothetical protein
MFKRFAALAAVVVVCAGCTIKNVYLEPPKAANDEDAAYLERATQTPLTFMVEVSKGDETWSRVNSFIAKYSSMKIQTASDYIIETYNPTEGKFGYSANRATKEDRAEFTVNCAPGPGIIGIKFDIMHGDKIAEQNAHLLAFYALTGEIRESLVVK